jgi:hypothetical protein
VQSDWEYSSFIGDVIFDNIFTDMAFHGQSPFTAPPSSINYFVIEKIKASVSNVEDVKSNASVLPGISLPTSDSQIC